jgi:hypothetical protein
MERIVVKALILFVGSYTFLTLVAAFSLSEEYHGGIPVDDIISGKVKVSGRYGVPIGTPVYCRVLSTKDRFGCDSVLTTCLVNGRLYSEHVRRDEIYSRVEKHPIAGGPIVDNGFYWVVEELYGFGTPIDLPRDVAGRYALIKSDMFRIVSGIRIYLPSKEKQVKSEPGKVPENQIPLTECFVTADEIETGKCKVFGKTRRELGRVYDGMAVVERTPSNAGSIHLKTDLETKEEFVFELPSVSVCRPGGSWVLNKKEKEASLDIISKTPVHFYESIRLSGIPPTLDRTGLAFDHAEEDLRWHHSLILCIEKNQEVIGTHIYPK